MNPQITPITADKKDIINKKNLCESVSSADKEKEK